MSSETFDVDVLSDSLLNNFLNKRLDILYIHKK